MTVSVDAAALDLSAFVRAGDRIVWGQACGEPTTLLEALIAQSVRGLAELLQDVDAFDAAELD